MSAYMVEESQLDVIVTAAVLRTRTPGVIRLSAETFDPNELKQLLYGLNARAVGIRYNDGPDPAAEIGMAAHRVSTPIRALKTLKCFLYQCMEGYIPDPHTEEDMMQEQADKTLYQLMRKFEVTLMNEIIEVLPEFQEAPW